MSRVLVYDDQLGALGGFRKGIGGIGEVRYGNGNQRIKLLIRQVVDGPVRIFFGIAQGQHHQQFALFFGFYLRVEHIAIPRLIKRIAVRHIYRNAQRVVNLYRNGLRFFRQRKYRQHQHGQQYRKKLFHLSCTSFHGSATAAQLLRTAPTLVPSPTVVMKLRLMKPT